MKKMRFVVYEDRPHVANAVFMLEQEAPFAFFRIDQINHSIFEIAAKLASVVRVVRRGYDLNEMVIPFYRHIFGGIALCIKQTSAGSDVQIEFREFTKTMLFGGADMQSENKLVHEAVLSPQQLADMLHDVLDALMQFHLADFYKTDRQSLKHVLENLCIYDTEGRNLEWPNTAIECYPSRQFESDLLKV